METPWKVIFAFLAVFVAGAVFGGFFTLGFGARWASQAERHEPAPVSAATATATPPPPAATKTVNEPRPLQRLPAAWDPKQLMRRYAERLQLTPEQKEKLEPVIKRAIEDYRRIQRTTFRDTSIVIERLQEDIAKDLTPEQRVKLDELRERQRELMKRFDERREQRRAQQKENSAMPTAPATSEPAASGEASGPSSSSGR